MTYQGAIIFQIALSLLQSVHVDQIGDSSKESPIFMTRQVHLFYSRKTYLWNKKDVHPLKPVVTGFFGVLGAKILRSKPWMLFRHFHEQEGFEPYTEKIRKKFKADLREKILNLPFLIYKIVSKILKAVLSNITN